MTIKQDIVDLIKREYGIHTAHVVLVALEVAEKRWTDRDTVDYGTIALNNLKQVNRER